MVCKDWGDDAWLEYRKSDYSELISNKCRNPASDKETIWCYTEVWNEEGETDVEKQRGTWEYCATYEASFIPQS